MTYKLLILICDFAKYKVSSFEWAAKFAGTNLYVLALGTSHLVVFLRYFADKKIPFRPNLEWMLIVWSRHPSLHTYS